MNMRLITTLSFFLLSHLLQAQQDTLPRFSVKSKNNAITISWLNQYKNTSQINIQRSKDSNRNFITIHSVPTPDARTYAYVDKTAKTDSGYYRIFILFDGANYMFTKPQKPVEDTIKLVPVGNNILLSKNEKQKETVAPPASAPPKKAWEPSVFIFTGPDGNVVIQLPDATTKKYSVRFSREEGRLLFTIPEVKEPYLILDKVTFLKSGWYYFELKENGSVKERNKFLITRDN